MADAKWTTPASIETWMSTELNSLANAACAASSVIDADAYGQLYADVEVYVTFGTAPTANQPIELYIARRIDGTNIEDYVTGASGTGPQNGYIGSVMPRAVTTAQRMILPKVELPPSDFVLLAINRTGQAMASSGNTVKAIRYTERSV